MVKNTAFLNATNCIISISLTMCSRIINLSKCKLKKKQLNLQSKDPKFTSATKGNILNSKSDILIIT